MERIEAGQAGQGVKRQIMRSKLAGKEEGFKSRTRLGVHTGVEGQAGMEYRTISKARIKIWYKGKKNGIRLNAAGDTVQEKRANEGWEQGS